MNTPVTTLDQRYSGAAAVAVTWDETRHVLETAELFWISTVRADGRPHVTPLVAVWSEEALWFTTGTGERKFANLRANPQVVLTTGCNSWDHGLDVVVEGEARWVTDASALEHVARAFAVKWQGAWQYTVRDGRFYNHDAGDWPSEVFSVTPAKVFAHAKGRAVRRHHAQILSPPGAAAFKCLTATSPPDATAHIGAAEKNQNQPE
jgi:nitroimidazol reductase NimA-like FMN-containing flavoprotein (pyridoxamine 5'-phosphate oxidase superfamily)